MGTKWLGVVAGALLIGGWTFAIAQQEPAPPAAPAPEAPGEEAEAPHPFEPILVQGYVKTVDEQQLTLTAPGAPVDLPLSLREETRYIRGEEDVERGALHEGQLVRAALLPVGEDLVALVVEVVPDEVPEEQQPGARGTGGSGGDGGLQGEAPPEETEPVEPRSPAPAEPMPPAPQERPGEGRNTTDL